MEQRELVVKKYEGNGGSVFTSVAMPDWCLDPDGLASGQDGAALSQTLEVLVDGEDEAIELTVQQIIEGKYDIFTRTTMLDAAITILSGTRPDLAIQMAKALVTEIDRDSNAAMIHVYSIATVIEAAEELGLSGLVRVEHLPGGDIIATVLKDCPGLRESSEATKVEYLPMC